MRYSINHTTTFDFDRVPTAAIQRLHLMPPDHAHQKVIEWAIELTGSKIELETTDHHGNIVHLGRHDMTSHSVSIHCQGIVDVTDANGIVGAHDNALPLVLYENPSRFSGFGPRTRKLADKVMAGREAEDEADLMVLHRLSRSVLDHITYEKGKTDVTTTAEQALEAGAGVCQDHVHVFCAVARLLGFKARYVSGYLMMDDTTIQDASHAWAEVHVDALGWVGFDISNSISPDDRYIRLATGFDYADVIPVSGVRVGDGNESMSTRIVVEQQ